MKLKLILIYSIFSFIFFSSNSPFAQEYSARGMIISEYSPVLSSQISEKIEEMPFKEGDLFKKDDILIKFDQTLLKAQQEKTISQLQAALIILENKKQLESLNSIGILDVKLAQAEVRKREAEKIISDIALERAVIKAPFNGRVSKLLVQRYETVSDQTKLMEIVNIDHLEIKILVPSSWLQWLKINDKFKIMVDDINLNSHGYIKNINSVVDPVSKMILIKGNIIQTAPNLLPGMSADVIFIKK